MLLRITRLEQRLAALKVPSTEVQRLAGLCGRPVAEIEVDLALARTIADGQRLTVEQVFLMTDAELERVVEGVQP